LSESVEPLKSDEGEPLQLRTESLRFLIDLSWWRDQWRISRIFARFCLLPGLGLGLLNIGVVIAYAVMSAQLSGIKSAQTVNETDLVRLLVILIVLMFSLIGFMILSFWFLWIWLMRLTAFSNAWLTNRHDQLNVECFKKSVDEIRQRKQYYGLLWVVSSLYLLLPAIPLALMIALNVFMGPEFSKLLLLPAELRLPLSTTATTLMSSVLWIIVVAYTILVIVLSSVSKLSPGRTATLALRECFRHILPILGISLVVFLGNVIISAPQMMLFFTDVPSIMNRSVWLSIVVQAWFGVSSLFLWPLSMAPFCQIVVGSDIGAKNIE
jgi:hypothetical protein